MTNNHHSKCGTCGRPANDPARRWINGRIVEGCVAAAHDGITAAQTSGQSVAWHNRREAKALRAAERKAYK